MKKRKKLGRNIEVLRLAREMSAQALAAELGMSTGRVYNIEKRDYPATEKELSKFSDFFSVPQKELLGEVFILKAVKQEFMEITDIERQVGRSEDYYSLPPEQQWAQDDKLGLLDWDGTEKDINR